jgi:hypothetical protein
MRYFYFCQAPRGVQKGAMFESSQVECICGKPVTTGNEEEHAAGKILEVIGEKKIQLFHSIDCALISKRLESVYNNSNLFFD